MGTTQNKSFPVEVWNKAEAVRKVLQNCQYKTASDIYQMFNITKTNDKDLLRGALERLDGIRKDGHGKNLYYYHGQAPLFVNEKPVISKSKPVADKAIAEATEKCVSLLGQVPAGQGVNVRELTKLCGSYALWMLVSQNMIENKLATCPLVNGRRGNLWYAVTEGGK
jgi:hypothetical protein